MSSIEWYALHSHPRKEKILSEILCNNGINCFFPTIKVHTKDKHDLKLVPYFPNYLFVHVDLEGVGISKFKWMPYVTGLVSFDGIPATIPDALINEIIHRVDEINFCCDKPLKNIKPGDRVLIESGLFEGYEAIFDTCLSGTERVRVLMQLIGQDQFLPVILPIHQIRIKSQKKH